MSKRFRVLPGLVQGTSFEFLSEWINFGAFHFAFLLHDRVPTGWMLRHSYTEGRRPFPVTVSSSVNGHILSDLLLVNEASWIPCSCEGSKMVLLGLIFRGISVLGHSYLEELSTINASSVWVSRRVMIRINRVAFTDYDGAYCWLNQYFN